jgi:hypothetical protein
MSTVNTCYYCRRRLQHGEHYKIIHAKCYDQLRIHTNNVMDAEYVVD